MRQHLRSKTGQTYLDWHLKKVCPGLNQTAEVSPSLRHLAGEHHGEFLSTVLDSRRARTHFSERKREEWRREVAAQSSVLPMEKLGCALQPRRLCVVRTGLRLAHISTKQGSQRQCCHCLLFHSAVPKRPFRARKVLKMRSILSCTWGCTRLGIWAHFVFFFIHGHVDWAHYKKILQGKREKHVSHQRPNLLLPFHLNPHKNWQEAHFTSSQSDPTSISQLNSSFPRAVYPGGVLFVNRSL